MNTKLILQFMIRDPIRKIFAIIFAFGLWFYVAIDKNYQYAKEIQMLYINLPESLTIVNSVSSIDVAFKGRGGSLLSIWAAPPKAQCDLSNSRTGKIIIPVKELTIPVSFGDVSISYVNLASVNLTLDKKIAKRIDLAVPIKDSLRGGYSISNVLVLDTIIVTGPKEILDNLRELMTESISVRTLTSPIRRNVKILNPSPLLKLSKDRVSVKIESDTTIEKLFTNIFLKLTYAPNQRIGSEKMIVDTLIVRGPKSKIEKLEKKNIEVMIMLTDLSPGDYNLPAKISLPEYIKPVYSKPRKFRIKIY